MGAPLRLVFFGTPDFAVPTLERLVAGPHDVVCVVSQPDRPRGRGRKADPSPVSQVALREEIPLLRPEKVGEPEVVEAIRSHDPDLGVVVAFGQFLTKRVREAPRMGYLINGHASLLPKHRGAAPIARAILAGDTVTGTSVMRVEREMDAGAVALVRELPIGPDETAGELTARMAELTAGAIADGLDAIADGSATWTEQDHDAATLAPKLDKREAELDWSLPAETLALHVRAFSPAPGAWTRHGDETLRILRARCEPGACGAPPGTVRRTDDAAAPLRIATADGWLVPLEIQRAGKKPLPVDAYLRGRDLPDGERLGRDPATATIAE